MKYQVNATGCPDPIGAASKGTTAGRLVFVSGQVSLSDDGATVIGSDVSSQTSRILDQAESVLAEAGLDLDDIAKVTVFLTNLDDLDEFDEVYSDRLVPPMPARSVVCVKELPFGALVQMDAAACR